MHTRPPTPNPIAHTRTRAHLPRADCGADHQAPPSGRIRLHFHRGGRRRECGIAFETRFVAPGTAPAAAAGRSSGSAGCIRRDRAIMRCRGSLVFRR